MAPPTIGSPRRWRGWGGRCWSGSSWRAMRWCSTRGQAREVQRREPYAAHFDGWQPPWNYVAPAQTRERLLRAGFSEATCWLQPAPRRPEQPREFLSTIVLGPHVQRLPDRLRDPFM